VLPITITLLSIAKTSSKNTQFILNVVWKVIYGSYKFDYLELKFEEETLKERLWKTLQELKTRTSNEEGSDKVVL
jgi:hypothetical protein